MKSIIRKLFNSFGYDISKINYRDLPKSDIKVLKLLVEKVLANSKNFYFVQIGANDGIRNDPIHNIVKRYHLRGLLVEPIPKFFEQLKSNYSRENQLEFENSAIGSQDGMIALYRFADNAPVPEEYFHGLARFDKEYMMKRAKKTNLEKYIQKVEVNSISVESLLEKYNIKSIELLQIDTEGYDFEIIKMFFQNEVFPKIINYEWTELSHQDRYLCRKLLLNNNYSFLNIGADTLCFREL